MYENSVFRILATEAIEYQLIFLNFRKTVCGLIKTVIRIITVNHRNFADENLTLTGFTPERMVLTALHCDAFSVLQNNGSACFDIVFMTVDIYGYGSICKSFVFGRIVKLNNKVAAAVYNVLCVIPVEVAGADLSLI